MLYLCKSRTLAKVEAHVLQPWEKSHLVEDQKTSYKNKAINNLGLAISLAEPVVNQYYENKNSDKKRVNEIYH